MKRFFLIAVAAVAIANGAANVNATEFNPGPHIIVPNVTVADDNADYARKVKFIQRIFPNAPVAFIEFVLDYCDGVLYDALLYIDQVL